MMEVEVCYSSVFFIKPEESKPREELHARESVYAEVKKNEVKAELSPATVSTADDTSLPGPHRYGCAVVVLGLLTALLLSALVALLVYYQGYVSESNTLLVRELHQLEDKYTTLMTDYVNLSNYNEMLEARYENTSAENQHLHSEMSQLQKEKKSLKMERDHLNQSLEVIFQFSVFPVDDYCPVTDHASQERKCEYCKAGWVYYQSSCYLINLYKPARWNTWARSRADCTKRESHLVTIDTAEEQAFINNHTKYYLDKWHGYWIGLSKIQGQWQWVDGSDLTGGNWISKGNHPCVTSMPSTDPSKSWTANRCSMRHRWICEMEAASWPE